MEAVESLAGIVGFLAPTADSGSAFVMALSSTHEAEPRVHCPPRLFTGLYEPVTSFGNNPLVLVFIADPGLGVEAAGLGAAVTGCKI